MDVTIRPLGSDEDAAAFRSLNEEWITRHFVLEAEDRRQLDDPVRAYIEPGGEILIAELGGRAVGCAAIVPDGTGAWELSKMAVAPELRGRGAGRQLLTATVERARQLGARSLFLGSSTKLPHAVHLYETLGFRHVPPEALHMPYDRADVFMQLVLEPEPPAARSTTACPRLAPALSCPQRSSACAATCVILLAVALAACGSSSRMSTRSSPQGAHPATEAAPPRRRPAVGPLRADALVRALLTRGGPPRPTFARCLTATPAERAAAPFGRTQAPVFSCLLSVRGERARYDVQVLSSGCYVAERHQPGRAVYGCGAKAP